MSGVTASAPIVSTNGRNGHACKTPEQISAGWKCKKRNGAVVAFDCNKIRAALRRCFASVGEDVHDNLIINTITLGVVNNLLMTKKTCPDVEEVQQLIIQQLWGLGLFKAGEHYQNYREQHRLAREKHAGVLAQAAAVDEDRKHFPNPISYYQFLSKFARYNDAAGRRETWREACDRVMGWFKSLPRAALTEAEWAMLDASLFRHETCCAMRVVQMAGPALERCHVGAYNCAYTSITDLKSFAEFLYVLMAGGGCGFSVEEKYVSQLPRIARQKVPAVKTTYVVPDTTEGWCDALLYGLERWFAGEDVWFDVSLVRPKGARLKTKGGRASGPGPLLELLCFARKLVMSRQGKVLTDLDCHDLCCMIGRIVQVGGVRRAAAISFSDLDSTALRDCKSGNWYQHAVYRTMANNSAVYDGRPDIDTYLAEMTALVKSKSGERGIFNLKATLDLMPTRRERRLDIRGNPCGEINIRPRQFCNLSIVVARPWDTRATLLEKVRIAAYWGCLQKTATDFKYLRPEWKYNCEDEALLGVDITGHADCPLLRFGAPGRAELLRELAEEVRRVDVELSRRFGVRESAANTCVKPSGDSAVFFDCASGCSPWFDDYILRWVREPAASPMAKFLIAEGVPYATAPEDPSLLVFGFLRKAPKGATTRYQMTAIDQLNNWWEWKQNWAEHSVSCTVYVDEHEWPAVMAWCYENFDKITGLSFLPRDNGVYTYAPNEAVTAEHYAELEKNFPTINWAKLAYYEDGDETSASAGLVCTAQGCSVG